MASEQSLILRNAKARRRITDAIHDVRNAGIDIPELPVTGRDKHVRQAQELENAATVLEHVAGHLSKPAQKTTAKK